MRIMPAVTSDRITYIQDSSRSIAKGLQDIGHLKPKKMMQVHEGPKEKKVCVTAKVGIGEKLGNTIIYIYDT